MDKSANQIKSIICQSNYFKDDKNQSSKSYFAILAEFPLAHIEQVQMYFNRFLEMEIIFVILALEAIPLMKFSLKKTELVSNSLAVHYFNLHHNNTIV